MGDLIKQLKKRGRKKGQLKKYCKLPHCSRCDVRLWNGNGIHKSDGKFTSYCNNCNTDVAIIKNWKKKSIDEILSRIWWHGHMIELLYESRKERKNQMNKKVIRMLQSIAIVMINEDSKLIKKIHEVINDERDGYKFDFIGAVHNAKCLIKGKSY